MGMRAIQQQQPKSSGDSLVREPMYWFSHPLRSARGSRHHTPHYPPPPRTKFVKRFFDTKKPRHIFFFSPAARKTRTIFFSPQTKTNVQTETHVWRLLRQQQNTPTWGIAPAKLAQRLINNALVGALLAVEEKGFEIRPTR